MQYEIVGKLGTCPPDSGIAEIMVHPHIEVQVPKQLRFYENIPLPINIDPMYGQSYSYHWSPEDLIDCVGCEDIEVMTDRDTFLVLNVEDKFGCQMNDTLQLRKIDRCPSLLEGVYIPNIFSPNEDGTNDVFKIEAPLVEKIEGFKIFDRWGEKLFVSGGSDIAWDGTFLGKRLPPGVYVYVIDIRCELNGEIISTWGDITLIR